MNLGSALQINPTTKQVEVANVDIARFASTVRPIALFSSDPSLPDSNYPAGTYGFNVTSHAFKRVNDAGNAWVLAINGGKDIQAGSITATQIDTTSLNAAVAALGYATITYLTANYITASAIAASYATFGYLGANYLTAASIAANYATIAALHAETIDVSRLSAGTVSVSSDTNPVITVKRNTSSLQTSISPQGVKILDSAGNLAVNLTAGSTGDLSLYYQGASKARLSSIFSGGNGSLELTALSGGGRFFVSADGTLEFGPLPSSNPGAGSKRFWYDPADGNRVKFAA